jgi:hypothetical protein
MGVDAREQARVANLLNFREGAFPFRYLGFPMSDKKHTIADMEPVVATFGGRMEPWQGRFLSSASRLILTDSCLSSLPLHTMSLFPLADGTHAGFGREWETSANNIGLIRLKYANHVGIHPRIDHIKLDEHTRRLLLSPSVRIARSKLFSLFLLLFLRCLQLGFCRVYMHGQLTDSTS